MDLILSTYLAYQNWIDLIKDVVFFIGSYAFFRGAYVLFQYWKNKEYIDVSSSIEKNIKFREHLEPLLDEFVVSTAKNTKDVAIRFVYWKNYPWNLKDDAYKHYPWIRYFDDNSVQSGWLDNTGVNIQHPLWYFGTSLYIDKRGIFFISLKGLTIKGFKEFQDTTLVLHLPFENIVNYDFKQFIEYEPIFYIRYPYNQRKKLYDDHIVVRNKDGQGYLNIDLYQHNWMKKFSLPRYTWFRFKFVFSSIMFSKN